MREMCVEGASMLTMLGCGRFFEGTPAEMNTALNETLASLPDDTKVYVSAYPLLYSLVRPLTGSDLARS